MRRRQHGRHQEREEKDEKPRTAGGTNTTTGLTHEGEEKDTETRTNFALDKPLQRRSDDRDAGHTLISPLRGGVGVAR
jgi:hypothetical protein